MAARAPQWRIEGAKVRIKDRLRAFMALHRIEQREMAKRLRTPYGTFEKWMREDDAQPPGCMHVVIDALEKLPEFRRLVGMQG